MEVRWAVVPEDTLIAWGIFMIDANYLAGHALFGGVPPEELKAVIPLFAVEEYTAGEFIVREGDTGNCMYFIRAGTVEVLKSSDAREPLRLAILREGDTFGEMELIDVQPRSASVRALEPLSVLSLSSDDLYDIFRENQSVFIIIVMNIAREISRRLRKMDALMASSLYRQGRPAD